MSHIIAIRQITCLVFNYGIYELRRIYSMSTWTSDLGIQVQVNQFCL